MTREDDIHTRIPRLWKQLFPVEELEEGIYAGSNHVDGGPVDTQRGCADYD